MDIGIALTIAAMLAPYLSEAGKGAAKKAGEKTWEKLGQLYETIKRQFAKDEHATRILEQVAQEPTAETRIQSLADTLLDKAQSDPKFAKEVIALAREITQDQTFIQILNQFHGKTRVKNIINIGTAGDLTFN